MSVQCACIRRRLDLRSPVGATCSPSSSFPLSLTLTLHLPWRGAVIRCCRLGAPLLRFHSINNCNSIRETLLASCARAVDRFLSASHFLPARPQITDRSLCASKKFRRRGHSAPTAPYAQLLPCVVDSWNNSYLAVFDYFSFVCSLMVLALSIGSYISVLGPSVADKNQQINAPSCPLSLCELHAYALIYNKEGNGCEPDCCLTLQSLQYCHDRPWLLAQCH
jgi:hypothetical protein